MKAIVGWSWVFLFSSMKGQSRLNVGIFFPPRGRLETAGTGTSLSPYWFVSEKNSVIQALVNQFLLRSDLVKENLMFWYISKCFLFLPPCQKHMEFFLNIHCETVVQLLEIKLTKVWRPPYDWASLKFLTFRFVHTEPPPIGLLQFSFSYPGMLPWKCLLMDICSNQL